MSVYVFDEFFDSGREEVVSPFLKPQSRKWGRNLPLRASLIAALCLLAAFAAYFKSPNLCYLLLIPVYFLAGIPKLIESIYDIASLQINIDVLMTLAAFLSVLIGSPIEGALLLVLFAISGSLEEMVTSKAKSAVRSLHKLAPSKACLIDEKGRIYERHIRDIAVGQKILVKAGEIVPLDGIVADGTSSVNLAHITGESLPEKKGPGDEVPSGATNMEGALVLTVSHISGDSTISRIIRLITQAQEAKPQFQRWLDKASKGYAITIILLSLLFAIVLPLPFLGEGGSLYRALAFLIAASPCALIIALPVAYLSAISSCARNGVLLKGGVTLDAFASCKTIAFDKTGTLTTGELTCLGMEPFDLKALAIAAELETKAVHPIAKAVLNLAKEHDLPQVQLSDFRSIPGYGLEARVGSTSVYIGHPDHLKEAIGGQKEGELLSLLAIGDERYTFRFNDQPRSGVRETIANLRRELRPVILTGDHKANAESVARQVGIDEVLFDLRPEDKLDYVSRTEHLAMVGDGINDAPALARATTGISMGKVGSRTAIDASDVVLLHDDLNLLTWLRQKSKQTLRIVKQNVALASVAIVVASLSALMGWIPLWLAVVLHEGGTVLVGLNSLRLLRS